MDPTMLPDESYVLGRKPVNIFTFTTMAMRMSVYWYTALCCRLLLIENDIFRCRLHYYCQRLLYNFNFTSQCALMSIYYFFLCVYFLSLSFARPLFISCGRTSVMFVSISFIVLMMISLAWLVFYYIQRFRYLHAKDRLSVSGFFILLLVSFIREFSNISIVLEKKANEQPCFFLFL